MSDLAGKVVLVTGAARRIGRGIALRLAADPANAATKDDFLKTAAALKPRLDQLNALIALYDSFATSSPRRTQTGRRP